jgi:hypothetical protein
MLLHNLKKNSVCCLTILIVFVFCMTQYTIADDDLDQLTKDIKETLRSLGIPQSEESKKSELNLAGAIQAFSEALASEDEETKDIFKQWENYIISVSHFSNTNYANAINKQLADYYKAIADINNTLQENKAKRKSEYSSSWVDDLVDYFGREFVKKNKTAIKYCLMAISFPDESFEDKLKDLIYIEAMLFGSYKRYFGLFLAFYKEKLDQNAQNKIKAHKKIAENFLALIDKVSFTSMHDTTVLMNNLTENKARRLNDEVFTFLKSHHLSHTLDNYIRPLEDLKKATEK